MNSMFNVSLLPGSRFGGLLLAILLAGCATAPVDESRQLWSQGRIEESVTTLREALARRPQDTRLKAAYERRREQALSQLTSAAEHLRDARQYDEARKLLQSALRLDPEYPRARDALAELDSQAKADATLDAARSRIEAGDLAGAESLARQVVTQYPAYGPARRLMQQVRQKQGTGDLEARALKPAVRTPISLDLRDTPMRNVFDALSQTAGLNFVFDRDVHTDTKITIFIRNNSLEDVLRLILSTNGLQRKVLNDNTVLVYPATSAKEREYQELVVRTFYLVNADAKQIQGLLKSMAKIKEIYIDDKLNLVTVRDTPDAVRLAERLVDTVDVAESEVMLEVEVMEIGLTRLQQLGLEFPTQVTRGLTGSATTVLTSQLGQTVTSFTNPALIANLFVQDQDTNLLANPRIRVKNHEKAKVQIGEKLPVITTTAVPSVGQSTAVSYIDIGLKLEVEPQIYLNDEVGIKVNLEVNSNLGAVNQNGVTAYDVGTRSANTVLRLHDGETQVLAGLINDNDQSNINRLPLLGDIPVIGRLFSSDNSTREKSEIVLLITPRIIRSVVTPDYDALLLQSGTEAEAGTRGMAIAPTAPRSLAVSGAPGAMGGDRKAAPAGLPAPAPALPASSLPLQPPLLVAALKAPERVGPGIGFSVQVDVSGAGAATAGEATVTLDPASVRVPGSASGAAAGQVTVHLAPSGSGGLSGSTLLEMGAFATGTVNLNVSAGFAQLPDGTQRAFDSAGSTSITVGAAAR